MPRTLSRAIFALAIFLSLPLGRASAWTEARVTTADAIVTVDEAGLAQVAMKIGLSIDAGWLEGLEIAGLDAGLLLDPDVPILIVSEEGERFRPEVRTSEEGRIFLSFPRREAPRRGHYHAELRYRASIAGRTRPTDEGRVRFEWTLPGWHSGLDGVSIQIRAPRGAVLAAPDDLLGVEARSHDEGDQTVLTFHRAHLPRTIAWSVAFELPEASVAEALRRPSTPAAPPPSPRRAAHLGADEAPGGLAIALVFGAVSLLSASAFRHAARRRGVTPRPLVPLGPVLHAIVVAALTAAAAELARRGLPYAPTPLFALVLLNVQRAVGPERPPRLGAFRRVTKQDIARSRRAALLAHVSPERCFDLTRPAGLTVAAAAVALLFVADGAEGGTHAAFGPYPAGVLLLALFLTAPASRIPQSPTLRLCSLVRFARDLRIPLDADTPLSLCLLVHEDTDGTVQDARLRLGTEIRPRGLLRLDVVELLRDGLGGHRVERCLLVVTRAGTAADALVSEALPHLRPQRAPAGRHARIANLRADLPHLLTAFAAAPKAHSSARRTQGRASAACEPSTVAPRLAS